MNKSVAKYRVYCQTETQYTYVWNDSLPIHCPNNTQHTIDTNTIAIVETINTNSVNIIQESKPTGGNYRSESKKITISANATETFDFTWPYLLSVLTVTLYSNLENKDDVINLFVAPETTIGVLTQSASQGNTVLHVNSTVIGNIKFGYRINLVNPIEQTSVYVGECIAIDKENSTVTIDTALTENFSAGVLLQICVNNIKNFILRGETVYELSRKTTGTSSLPANTTVRLQYENNSNVEKEFYFSVEYYY